MIADGSTTDADLHPIVMETPQSHGFRGEALEWKAGQKLMNLPMRVFQL